MNTIKNAKFIKENADFGTVVPVFIKAIKSEKAIGKATLFCSSLGSYEAYINGKRIGDFIFAPGWTTYGKRLHGYGTTETVPSNIGGSCMDGRTRCSKELCCKRRFSADSVVIML